MKKQQSISPTTDIFKQVVYFCPCGGHHDQDRGNLLKKLEEISEKVICFSCPQGGIQAGQAADIIKSSSLVVHWNGSSVGSFWVTELCRAFDIPYVIVEMGLLPQKETYIFDKEGICCRSKSLGKNLKLKKEFKYDLSKVVFVCQLEFDTTVYHYSKFKNNEEFIDHYVSSMNINPSNVIICPHPRNPNITSKYKISNKKTINECSDCSLAIGISSTTMYEIALAGKNVMVVGEYNKGVHPINRHKNIKDLEQLILNQQINHKDSAEKTKQIILKTLNIQ
jgi:hypothetical protein